MPFIKVISFNINSIKVRNNLLLKIIRDLNPEIVLLQETRSKEILECENYYLIHREATKGRNGVAVYSKEKTDMIHYFSDRMIGFQYKGIHIFNIYAPNGGSPNSSVKHKIDFLENLYNICSQIHGPTLIGGDFNIVENINQTMGNETSSLPEIELMLSFKEIGFHNTSFDFVKNKYITWWDYRHFPRGGAGVDKFMVKDLEYKDFVIHKSYRYLEKTSDHAPISIEVKGR